MLGRLCAKLQSAGFAGVFGAVRQRALSRPLARISGRYYVEDFMRVYPDGICLDRYGRSLPATQSAAKNFLNHQKVYAFAAQLARDAIVADIGCGSGHGCALLKDAGATRVFGTDVSKHAIRFAKRRYGDVAEFSVQNITDMVFYADCCFDMAVCSEVLEHIKEYGKESRAMEEIKRTLRPGGTVFISTPNSELIRDHGFCFDELEALMKRHFSDYCIFENALVPFGSNRAMWQRRLSEGRTGVIVTEAIDLEETILPDNSVPELKRGIPAGVYRIDGLELDTTLLHNTHSWAIVARKVS